MRTVAKRNVINYTQRDVTRYYADTDRDEWYWDVIGVDWRVPTAMARLRLSISPEIANAIVGSPQCYHRVWSGSTTTCDLQTVPTLAARGINEPLMFWRRSKTQAAARGSRSLSVWRRAHLRSMRRHCGNRYRDLGCRSGCIGCRRRRTDRLAHHQIERADLSAQRNRHNRSGILAAERRQRDDVSHDRRVSQCGHDSAITGLGGPAPYQDLPGERKDAIEISGIRD